MNRGTRTLIVVTVAVVVATLATMAVFRAVQRIPVREVEQAGVPVVVAARSLPLGTMLTAADLRVSTWPARSPVLNGFSSPDQIYNRGLVADMVENEPVTAAKLAPLEAGAGLTPTIPTGMRAISVQVNDVVGVAGFVTPGNRVDVVATVTKTDMSMSRVVVSDVKVLASGTKDQQLAQTGAPIQTTVVTLLVTPADGERIALASVEGRLHLTLRNPLDVGQTETAGVRIAALLGGPGDPPPPAPKVTRAVARPVAPPPPPPVVAVVSSIYTVEAIRAAKRTDEVVK